VSDACALLGGADFASHSLWTAWICWTLSALLWHSAVAVPQRFNRLRASRSPRLRHYALAAARPQRSRPHDREFGQRHDLRQ